MPIRPLKALLLGAALAACSEPMERPAPPPAATPEEDEAKTAEIPMPEIRDAEGISPRERAEAAAEPAPLFDPREAEAATTDFAPGAATRPEAIGDAPATSRATGSFTAPGANETAWLVSDDAGAARLVIVSVRGAAQEVPLDLESAEIAAAEDTNMDGLTELVLYTPTNAEDGTVMGRADHVSLRSGELEMLETWDDLLTDPCGAETEVAERTGTRLTYDGEGGGITAEPFSEPC